MATDPLADLYVGEVLNARYEVLEYLASGGFCLVFAGRDRITGDDVALKILKPSVTGDGVIEFETEGNLLSQLRSASHVINLLGAVSNSDAIIVRKPGVPVDLRIPVSYLVLELADGCLADVVVNRSIADWGQRLLLFRDLVKGVHQMHLKGVVHRDLKSENVLLTTNGNAVTAKVSDLGRARAVGQPARFLADAYLAGRGDLRFAPPELLWLLGTDDGDCFRRADLYLLGSALFELATGQGITAIAYGNPRSTMASAVGMDADIRRQHYLGRLGEARARLEPAFRIFEAEVPLGLRFESTQLLRQLCDPDPLRRERRFRLDRAAPVWGLTWLIRRVDILRKLESVGTLRTSRKRAAK